VISAVKLFLWKTCYSVNRTLTLNTWPSPDNIDTHSVLISLGDK